uniref:ribonucleases P/MRP protein subunit POP1 isoform X2 n=1 Tax=Ciona intestinalis TaxID=7719 RepID=UPI000180D011|nr:ribonucleases P/MRP protein subunit POP1 isoform X2 [Ciona intestinalis]|eukprot:XP_018667943.1 ribonucleases P/MRP protein subunit POP1 isoform X2 [Ciona intestinalis]
MQKIEKVTEVKQAPVLCKIGTNDSASVTLKHSDELESTALNISKDPLPTIKQENEKKTSFDDKSDSRLRKWKKRMRFQPKNITTVEEVQHDYYKKLLANSDVTEVELPRVISVLQHANAAANEIQSMMSAIKQHSGNKTALQILPRHMRRRSAAHNVKRLPRRLRELAQQQGAQNGENTKVCRKKRRRNINLQNEYSKRAGKSGWLETHMWHAKRFHMTDTNDPLYSAWGHRVAIHPNDKSFRACYRATANHCLLQDISFYKCIQISCDLDKQEEIFCIIESLMAVNSNIPVKVKSGECEHHILIYDKRSEPPQLIGPASIMYQQQGKEQIIWLRIHPTLLEKTNDLISYLVGNRSSISITDISSELLRFRLSGPKSSVTLLSVLRPFNTKEFHDEVSDSIASPSTQSVVNKWIVEHLEKVALQNYSFVTMMTACHKQQFHKADKYKSGGVEESQIIPLIVNDPRLTLPIQKTPAKLKDLLSDCVSTTDVVLNDKSSVTSSPLWNSDARNDISNRRLSDNVVSTRKNETKFELSEDAKKSLKSISQPIPVILIRRSGFKKPKQPPTKSITEDVKNTQSSEETYFAQGWDLIIPAKWATAFWIPLVYNQARVGGIREQSRTHLECKRPFFPRDYPDCESGRLFWEATMKRKQTVYFRKPPAKRPNYSILATPFPFAPCWEHLFERKSCFEISHADQVDVKENTELNVQKNKLQTKELNVISEDTSTNMPDVKPKTFNSLQKNNSNQISGFKRQALDNISSTPSKMLKHENQKDFPVNVIHNTELLKKVEHLCYDDAVSGELDILCNENTFGLICVQISMINKGCPVECSSICVPNTDDIIKLEAQYKDLHGKGLANCSGPYEATHMDPIKMEKKRATDSKIPHPTKNIHEKKTEKPISFPVYPSRTICGFVTSGDYLFCSGGGGGVGFVTLKHLVQVYREQVKNDWLKLFVREVLHNRGALLLLRNPDSNQYRFAVIEIYSSE